MKDSVSGVFVSKSRVYFVKRQNYLPVFPGYHAPPGGKVDHEDSEIALIHPIWPKDINPKILHALIREIKEELHYDLEAGITNNDVTAIDFIGVATSPEFNPYRFNNYYLKVTMAKEIDFVVDVNEALYGEWKTPEEFIEKYNRGDLLAVPPAMQILKTFANDLLHIDHIPLNFRTDPSVEVPMIEALAGVRQFLPLSNTFPPANRTNSFIIGDHNAPKILIDPSPKDEAELLRFYKAIDRIGFDTILITHHHPDHYQFARDIALKYQVGIQLSRDTYNRIGPEYFNDININFLKEGDIVTKSLGEDVVVFEIPGHDEGQLGLAPKSNKWFLVGDLVQTIGTVVVSAPEGDMIKYFYSLKRVIELDPLNIIPSHGIILGGTNKLQQTLKHRMKREEQIIALMKENKSEEEILKIVYEDLSAKLMPYAKKILEAHLVKLKIENRI